MVHETSQMSSNKNSRRLTLHVIGYQIPLISQRALDESSSSDSLLLRSGTCAATAGINLASQSLCASCPTRLQFVQDHQLSHTGDRPTTLHATDPRLNGSPYRLGCCRARHSQCPCNKRVSCLLDDPCRCEMSAAVRHQ